MKLIFTYCFDTETKELTTAGNFDMIDAVKLLNGLMLDAFKESILLGQLEKQKETSEKPPETSGDEQEKLDKAEQT